MDSTSVPAAGNVAAALRITELVKHYGGTRAVDGVSLELERGQLFGFLGPNGAGKTTTIGCLTGLRRPTRGAIELLGEPVGERSHELRRRVGVMPEDLALFDDLYVQEFLAFSGRVFGLDARTTRERAEELIEALALAGVRHAGPRLGAARGLRRDRDAHADGRRRRAAHHHAQLTDCPE
jgi:ABC-2 type transport system ATP-binding protein